MDASLRDVAVLTKHTKRTGARAPARHTVFPQAAPFSAVFPPPEAGVSSPTQFIFPLFLFKVRGRDRLRVSKAEVMADLQDPATYHDPTLNPNALVPEYALRLAYKRAGQSGQVPVAALAALCDCGYTTAQTFATSFGSDRDKAEESMKDLPEIRDNLSARPSLRRAELGFLLTVWGGPERAA